MPCYKICRSLPFPFSSPAVGLWLVYRAGEVLRQLPRRCCFAVLLQGSAPRRGISTELPPPARAPRPCCSFSLEPDKAGRATAGTSSPCVPVKLQNRTWEFQAPSFLSFRPVNSGLLTLVRPAQGEARGASLALQALAVRGCWAGFGENQ